MEVDLGHTVWRAGAKPAVQRQVRGSVGHSACFLICLHGAGGRYGRKLTERDLQNRDLDGEEAEELAGGCGWQPCNFVFVFGV
jgi:hypothetical protein